VTKSDYSGQFGLQQDTSELINRNNRLCPRGAHTCALPLFYKRDLEINPVTLKLKGDLNIIKMHRHTENEAASLSI